jgi:hypothetical protein
MTEEYLDKLDSRQNSKPEEHTGSPSLKEVRADPNAATTPRNIH